MRNLGKYDYIFVDIDGTIIYGFYHQIMHHTWNWFRSDKISSFLMWLQEKCKFYKVNHKLLYQLIMADAWYNSKIVFLTVRAPHPSTFKMLKKVTRESFPFELVEQGSDFGYMTKSNYIKTFKDAGYKCILIDDDYNNRIIADDYDIDVLDPVGMYEKKIG
nr:MAG TPA: hypothetical protein [Caudoviricetes sp.]